MAFWHELVEACAWVCVCVFIERQGEGRKEREERCTGLHGDNHGRTRGLNWDAANEMRDVRKSEVGYKTSESLFTLGVQGGARGEGKERDAHAPFEASQARESHLWVRRERVMLAHFSLWEEVHLQVGNIYVYIGIGLGFVEKQRGLGRLGQKKGRMDAPTRQCAAFRSLCLLRTGTCLGSRTSREPDLP